MLLPSSEKSIGTCAGVPRRATSLAVVLFAVTLALSLFAPQAAGQDRRTQGSPCVMPSTHTTDPLVILSALNNLIVTERGLLRHACDSHIESLFLFWTTMKGELPDKEAKLYELCFQQMRDAYLHILFSVDAWILSELLIRANPRDHAGMKERKLSWKERDNGSALLATATACGYAAQRGYVAQRMEKLAERESPIGKPERPLEQPAERESPVRKHEGTYIFDDPRIQAKYDQEIQRYEDEKTRIIGAMKDNKNLHRDNLSIARKGSALERIEAERFKETLAQIRKDWAANEALNKDFMDSLPRINAPY
jgi:hypothetical protein